MLNPLQEKIASSILSKEKTRAQAKAVLNRPTSAVPTLLTTMLIVGIGAFFLNTEAVQLPIWVSVALMTAISLAATNAIELWTVRRKLEAVIDLLELSQNSDR